MSVAYGQEPGYRMLTARSGGALAALDCVGQGGGGGVDLVFTDPVIPGSINGLVLADRVKERVPGLPVLLTTGYNEDLVAHRSRATNMDALGKPYRRTELADRVRAALNSRHRTDPRSPKRPDTGAQHEA